jgi:hypothetical protein
VYRVLAELFPYIVLFYLVDAIIWVRRHEWALISLWLGSFRLHKHGLHIGGISPTAEVISSYRLPLNVTSQGVYVPASGREEVVTSAADDLHFTPFDAMSEVKAEDKVVRSGSVVLLKAASPAIARRTASLLEELRRVEPQERASCLRRRMHQAVDLDRLRSRREEHADGVSLLRVASTALAASVFVLLPVDLFSGSLPLPGLLPGIAILYATVIITSAAVLRDSGTEARAVASAIAPLLVLPPAAMHAVMVVGREMYADFDPLAVAAELLPLSTFRDLARREYHDIRTAREKTTGTDLGEFWSLRASVWHRVLSKRGLRPEDVLGPPAKSDETSAAYCPRCCAEYQTPRGMCADCAVALEAFGEEGDNTVSASVAG